MVIHGFKHNMVEINDYNRLYDYDNKPSGSHMRKPSAGLIYVLYETPQQRLASELALNGAWFEGKKITATGAVHAVALRSASCEVGTILMLVVVNTSTKKQC